MILLLVRGTDTGKEGGSNLILLHNYGLVELFFRTQLYLEKTFERQRGKVGESPHSVVDCSFAEVPEAGPRWKVGVRNSAVVSHLSGRSPVT